MLKCKRNPHRNPNSGIYFLQRRQGQSSQRQSLILVLNWSKVLEFLNLFGSIFQSLGPKKLKVSVP